VTISASVPAVPPQQGHFFKYFVPVSTSLSSGTSNNVTPSVDLYSPLRGFMTTSFSLSYIVSDESSDSSSKLSLLSNTKIRRDIRLELFCGDGFKMFPVK